jgi:hypothetical protein
MRATALERESGVREAGMLPGRPAVVGVMRPA